MPGGRLAHWTLVVAAMAAATVAIVVGDVPTIALDPVLVLVVIATTAAGERWSLPRAFGPDVPTAIAVTGTFALLGAPAWAVAVAAVVGRAVAVLWADDLGWAELTPVRLARPLVTGWLAAGAVAAGSLLPLPTVAGTELDVGSALVLAGLIITALPVYEALSMDDDAPFHERLAATVEANWMTELALASTAALGALVHPQLGVLAVPFVLLPVLAARSGLKGYLKVRVQHDQTVRAISRLPEELGDVPRGHAERTAALARSAALVLGLDAEERRLLTKASQLHELGRIRHEPDEELTPRTIALNGSSILHESGLSDVASIVGMHRDRLLGSSVPARLVRLACELDMAYRSTGDQMAALSAVTAETNDPDELKLLGAFDPSVLEAH